MDLTVGMRGSISLQGLEVGGIPCRFGTVAPGVIEGISGDELTVRLDAPFGGQDVLEIGTDRFVQRTLG
jgi:hypothetical protein